AALRQAETQDQSSSGDGEHERVPKLDVGEAGEIDGGEARAVNPATGVDVGHRRANTHDLAHARREDARRYATVVDQERAGRWVAGLLPDVGGVGDDEAVGGRGRELLDDPGEVEIDID